MASPLLSTYMEGQSLVMSESFKYYFCVWLLLNLKRKKKLAQVRCLSYWWKQNMQTIIWDCRKISPCPVQTGKWEWMCAGCMPVCIVWFPSGEAGTDPPEWLMEAESHFRTMCHLCAYWHLPSFLPSVSAMPGAIQCTSHTHTHSRTALPLPNWIGLKSPGKLDVTLLRRDMRGGNLENRGNEKLPE